MQIKPVLVLLLAISIIVACWYISIPIQQTASPGFAARPRFKIRTQTQIKNSSTENPKLTSTQKENTTTSRKLTVEEIGFTIKTSEKFHSTRVDLILRTWFPKTNGQITFITDGGDAVYEEKSGNKLIASNCGRSHGLVDLCCKVGHEYDKFIADPSKRWWCHFDDDNYVHVEKLVDYLDQFDTNQDWYIGRKSRPNIRSRYRQRWYTYEFATGGGGVCTSRALAEKMKPFFANGEFPKTCQAVGAADDCVVGFVATILFKTKMIKSPLFHSHIEKLNTLNASTLPEQVCVSYKGSNVVTIPSTQPQFTKAEDPTRLLSLHCWIYPQDDLCANLKKS